jgi:hypothetical protein
VPNEHKSNIKSVFSKDVLFLLVLGLAGLLFSFCRRNDAFPAASLELSVSRSGSVKIAQRYARLSGFTVTHETATSKYFAFDHPAATFLEYELDLAEANRLMKTQVPIWHWDVHMVEKGNDEFEAEIGIDSKVHSFERELSNDERITSEPHDVAKTQVVDFAARELQISLPNWNLISEAESNLPARTDHTFTWEDQQSDFKGGHLRLSATVAGDKLTRFKYFLHVPDSFTQKFKWLRAQNYALANIPFIISFLALMSLPIIFLRDWINGQLRLKFAVGCGLIGAVVSFATSLNDTASIIASTSHWSMAAFLARHALNDFTTALLVGLAGTIFSGAIEVCYRTGFPRQVAFEILVGSSKALNSLSVAKSAVLGTAMFGILTGYQVLFFLVAKNYGLWIPLAVHDRSVINSFCPAWDAISLGLKASTIEELGFRIFLLIVFQKLTGSFWLANLLQAATWGFGHCTYAVEPPYSRGIELTIAGLFFGWAMRRYGVLSLILGHYAFDVYLSVISLFGSRNFLDIFAAVMALAPLIVLPAFCLYFIHRRGVAPEETINNLAIVVTPPSPKVTEPEQQLRAAYKPLTNKRITILLEVLLVATVILLIPARQLGDEPIFTTNRAQAISIARRYFEQEKFDVHDMQATAWLSDDTNLNQMQYIFQHASFERAEKVEKLIEPRLVWNVRMYKVGEPNTLSLQIGPDGTPVSADIVIDEMTAGAKLTHAEALQLAENYLKQMNTATSSVLKIFDISKTEHPNRIDYNFIAEDPSAKIKDARFQVRLKVLGNHISDVRRYWSLPKSVTDKQRKTQVGEFWVNLARLVGALILVPNIGYWVFYTFKKSSPNKLAVSILVLLAALIAMLEQINYQSCQAFSSYIPTEPLDTYLLQVAFRAMTSIAIDMVIAAFLAALVTACYPSILAGAKSVNLFKSARLEFGNYRTWSDAILIGYTAALTMAAFVNLNGFLVGTFSPGVVLTRIKHAVWLEQYSPALASVLVAVEWGLLATLVTAAGMRWSQFYQAGGSSPNLRKPDHKSSQLFAPIFILIVICLYNLDDHDPVRIFIHISTALACAVALYILIGRIGGTNLASCFFALFFLVIRRDAFYMNQHFALVHPFDTLVLSNILFIPLGWLCLLAIMGLMRRRRKPIGGEDAVGLDQNN